MPKRQLAKRPPAPTPPPAIGVDIGGVVIRPARKTGDTSFFTDAFLDTPAVDGAFDGVAALNQALYPGAVQIVSKAGPRTAEKTRLWLKHHRFHDITGVGEDRLHFCRTREDKAPIARRLGLTAFVDDRVDVLEHLGFVPLRVLFRETDALPPSPPPPAALIQAAGWREVLERLNAARAA